MEIAEKMGKWISMDELLAKVTLGRDQIEECSCWRSILRALCYLDRTKGMSTSVKQKGRLGEHNLVLGIVANRKRGASEKVD